MLCHGWRCRGWNPPLQIQGGSLRLTPITDVESEEILLTWKGELWRCCDLASMGCFISARVMEAGRFPLTGLQPSGIFRIYWLRFSGLMWTRSPPLLAYGILEPTLLSIQGARPEIWAFGFRNPFKMSFESRSERFVGRRCRLGTMGIGDACAQGGNYGWSIHEKPPYSPTP